MSILSLTYRKTNLETKKKQNVDPTSDSRRREERGG